MIRRNISVVGLVISLLFMGLFSCTKVDNTLGSGFIPDDQKMKLFQDTIYGINAYLAHSDTLKTSGASSGIIGSTHTATFGTTRAATIVQYAWEGFSSAENTYFGIAPKPDSITFMLTVLSAKGDTSKVQTFNIYEMTERIIRDSIYYANFDVTGKYNPILLGSFTYTGDKEVEFSLRGPGAESLMNRLVDTTGSVYTDDSLFVNRFKGLYITPADGSPKDASLVEFEMAKSGMSMVVRNFTDATQTKVKDTVIVSYSFNNTAISQSINTFKHDYSGTLIVNLNDTLPTSTPVKIGYVQTQGGVTTYLRFTESFVNNLRGKIVAPYKSMVVNNASIEIVLEDPTIPNLEYSPLRLGMYANYPKFTPIKDYDFLYEDQYSTTLPYGGLLNRTRSSYKMDISAYVQTMLLKPEIKSRILMIAPSYRGEFRTGGVALRTESLPTDVSPLRVVLTYTLVR